MTDKDMVLKALYDTCYLDNIAEIKSKIDSLDLADIDSISTLSSDAIDDMIFALIEHTYEVDSKPLGVEALCNKLCSCRAAQCKAADDAMMDVLCEQIRREQIRRNL